MTNFSEKIKSALKENQKSIQRWTLSALARIGNIAAITTAWIIALFSIIVLATPPYINESAPLIAILVLAVTIGLPVIYRPLQRLIGTNVFNISRGVIALVIFILAPQLSETYKQAQYNSLSSEEKERIARKNEVQAFWDAERAEKERIAEAARKFDERQKKQQDLETEKEKREIEIDNSQQETFYEQLGAPKLLYKCKDSPVKKAIGVNFGTYNRLIEEVNRVCGTGNVDILKKKE